MPSFTPELFNQALFGLTVTGSEPVSLFDPALFDSTLFVTGAVVPIEDYPIEEIPDYLFNRVPEDYSDLITPFHIHRSKFITMVQACASALIETGKVAKSLPKVFDLDSAVGVQLDIVGLWIGRNRFIPYPFQTFWFSFDDHLRGFDLAVWQGAYDADYGQYRLADEDFRRLLYAQIGINYWDGTFESM